MSVIEQEVPKGYQQTDVGLLPNDWKASTLGEFVHSLEAGISVNSVDKRQAFSHGKHILKTSCVSNGYFYPREAKSIIPNDVRRAKTSPTEGAIIVSRMNTPDLVGELGFIDQTYPDLFLPDRLWQMCFRSNVKINTRWLAYILSFPEIANKIKESATGTSNSMKNISKGSLLSIAFPSPTFEEQTAIANALSDVDALLTELENLIAKKQAIKTATMQQLLTGKTRLPQFATHPVGTKPSELGEIPEDWGVKTYGEIFTFLTTATNSRSELSELGDVGYIHYGDIHTKWNNLLNINEASVPHIAQEKITSAVLLKEGDILMADASEDYDGIGKSVEVINLGGKKIISGLHTFLLRDTNDIFENGFKGYLHTIVAVKAIFDRLATGLKVYGISKSNLKNVPLPVPPKEEQTAIATILSDMDNEIQTLEQRLKKTRQIKQGMMQELLTGKTRLPF